MRGKLIQAVMNVCDDRITPAYAGKTHRENTADCTA